MGKIYNVQLNSMSGTASPTTSNTFYNIDWANLLPNKKFKLMFSFMSGINYAGNIAFPYIVTNILGNSYKPATNGYQNAYYLGHLRPTPALNYYCCYTADINENAPIYLETRPMINNLQIKVVNNVTDAVFEDQYATGAGAGTLTQTGFVVTVVTSTAGLITIGTVLTVSAVNRTITGILTGTGGVGMYVCNLSATVAAATAYTFPADATGNPIAPYILNLSFEELDE